MNETNLSLPKGKEHFEGYIHEHFAHLIPREIAQLIHGDDYFRTKYTMGKEIVQGHTKLTFIAPASVCIELFRIFSSIYPLSGYKIGYPGTFLKDDRVQIGFNIFRRSTDEVIVTGEFVVWLD